MGLKPLLGALLFFWFLAWLFVVLATAIIDWSNGGGMEFGIWRVCVSSTGVCSDWNVTENSVWKDCEGALLATRGFSVLSIIFASFPLLIILLLLVKPTMMSKSLLAILLCLIVFSGFWMFLAWVMYLGVKDRDHCSYQVFSADLGASWYLAFFAWWFSMIAALLTCFLFKKWKDTIQKAPRYMLGSHPYYVPSPYGPMGPQAPMGAKGYPYGPFPPYPPPPAPMASAPYFPQPAPYGHTPFPTPYAPAY
jgi:hypothetical protein